MMNFLPSISFERWDSFACLTPTLSPRPFPPRWAGKGANSPMWPRLFDRTYTPTGQWLTAIIRRACILVICRSPASGRVTRWATATCVMRPPIRPEGWAPKGVAGTVGQTAGTSFIQSVGHIGLLALLSAPAGVERGGGDRGGKNTTVGFLGRLGQAQWSRGENT
jgi:hypothetical protein